MLEVTQLKHTPTARSRTPAHYTLAKNRNFGFFHLYSSARHCGLQVENLDIYCSFTFKFNNGTDSEETETEEFRACGNINIKLKTMQAMFVGFIWISV